MRYIPPSSMEKSDRASQDAANDPPTPDGSGGAILAATYVGSMSVEQAADFLKMHPATVLAKARVGELPGAKPGKRWVFLHDDLAAYVRSLYSHPRQTSQGDTNIMEAKCHSTKKMVHRTGGPDSVSMDDEYSRALGLPTR